MRISMLLGGLLAVCAIPALAQGQGQRKACEDLKAEIDQRMQARGVQNYTLEVVAAEDVKPQDKVVGSCEGGSRKIVYKRAAKE
jgi:hypothetical protein